MRARLRIRPTVGVWLACVATICASTPLNAQDLEPRAYSASPVGTWFASVGFGRSSGSIAFDPTVPITNAKATFHFPALGLGHTFGVFGRQALLTAVLPYAWGNASGNVGDQSGMVYRSGLADVKAKFSINLRGNPAMTPREFAQRLHRRTILGASLTMSAPSGQYSGEKLINISTNRWSFKPELGISVPVKKFYFDLYGSDTFFTANSNFYPGQLLRTQAQLPAVQAHASYTVRRSLWIAIDATWYGGGASKINGGAPSERQSNTRLGAQVSLPLPDRQSLKFAYSSGVNARVGFQFNTLSVGWQYMWFGGP